MKKYNKRLLIDIVIFMLIIPVVLCYIATLTNISWLWIILVLMWVSIAMLGMFDACWVCNMIEYEEKKTLINNSKLSKKNKEELIHQLNMQYWIEPKDEKYLQHEVEIENLAWKILWF